VDGRATTELTISADDPGVIESLLRTLADALIDTVVRVTTIDGHMTEMTVTTPSVSGEGCLWGATHWQKGDPAPTIGVHAVPFDRVRRVHIY
jgi:hypothetical protein